jgi:hypothetical protein
MVVAVVVLHVCSDGSIVIFIIIIVVIVFVVAVVVIVVARPRRILIRFCHHYVTLHMVVRGKGARAERGYYQN